MPSGDVVVLANEMGGVISQPGYQLVGGKHDGVAHRHSMPFWLLRTSGRALHARRGQGRVVGDRSQPPGTSSAPGRSPTSPRWGSPSRSAAQAPRAPPRQPARTRPASGVGARGTAWEPVRAQVSPSWLGRGLSRVRARRKRGRPALAPTRVSSRLLGTTDLVHSEPAPDETLRSWSPRPTLRSPPLTPPAA